MTLTVLVDSAEQKPWCFPPSVPVERVSLTWGDYSMRGVETTFAIERKSLRDWVGTVWTDWTRFAKELDALRGYEMACIVVEAGEEAVRRAEYRYPHMHPMRVGARAAWARKLDELEPKKVLRAAAKVHAEYGVPVLFKPGRREAASFAIDLMRAWAGRNAA